MATLKYLWSHRAKSPVGSREFYRRWGKRVYSFPELCKRNRRRAVLVRKGASIDQSAEIGDIIIEGRVDQLTVGPLSFIGRVHITLHDNVVIGARVCINDSVRIFTASHDVSDPNWNHTLGKVIIEDYVWIGTGAMILPGVRLGIGAVVGAGSVVTKSVEAGSIVVGNPARKTSKKRSNKLSYNPCEFLAANRAWLRD
jgi:acetyltransferase-like isoleucine patch superfamily enzyme